MSEGIFNDKQMQSDKGKATALACIKENKDNLILWDRYHPISLFSIVEKKRNPESQVCYLMKISGWRDRRARYTTPLKSQIIERLSLLDHLLLHPYIWIYRVNQQVLISRSKTYVCIF